ncbi:transcriptional regulator [Undibacterium sp. YM2]|jgi:predicted DNA-binding transcriptional regulator YafY|uniref:helix-turn-helix transcriptional regulator n=1 Tax=Undibacterium sp. YM2 TaxID=2058625 RepID=UPI001331CFA3|nr:YafY family protein [Undibacterium sp. YM2]BBB66731.1 transcriptional regulator [Undibacterium sp. YM2]
MSQNYQPTTRVLALLELLQNHGQVSGAELSQMLEIDRRSLRRYIVTLEEMGIPIMTSRGRFGGYSIMPGFKLPPMMFNEEEGFAISIALTAARQLKLLDVAPSIESAQSKLQRILPDQLRQRLRAADTAIELNLQPAAMPADKEVLVKLSHAVAHKQSINLQYRSVSDMVSERKLDAYGLAFHATHWYVVGFCHLRQDIRSFRLDRVMRAELLSQQFTSPPDFSVISYLRSAVASIPRAYSVELLLKTDMQYARRYLSDAIAVLEQTTGGVLLYNQSEDLSWFARQLAALPFDFEVRKPAQLQDELRKVAERLLKNCS